VHAARALLAIVGTLVTAAALLLPFLAAGESHLQTGAPGGALRATAHVNFKIIIPRMLYLNVSDGDHAPGAQTVAIMSNNHNVTLAATLRASGATTPASDEASGNVILSAAAHKVIAQDAACSVGLAHDTRRVICTASMP